MVQRLLLGVILLVGIATQAAGEGFEFKGVPLGASQADLLKAHPRFKCSTANYCLLLGSSCNAADCIREITYGGAVMKNAAVKFVDGKLENVFVFLSPSVFDRLKDSLVEAYGPPSSTQVENRKTKAGVEVANNVFRWERSGTILIASRFSNDIETSSVFITSRAAVDAEARRRQDAVKSGAKDL